MPPTPGFSDLPPALLGFCRSSVVRLISPTLTVTGISKFCPIWDIFPLKISELWISNVLKSSAHKDDTPYDNMKILAKKECHSHLPKTVMWKWSLYCWRAKIRVTLIRWLYYIQNFFPPSAIETLWIYISIKSIHKNWYFCCICNLHQIGL